MTDFVEDAMKNKKGNESGLLTPAEMEAAELAALKGGNTKNLEKEEDDNPDKNKDLVTPEKVQAIREKIEKDEELDEEETLIMANIDELVKEKAPETYKVGDKSYTREEAELAAREKVGLGAVKLSQKAVDKLIEQWHQVENKKEANQRIDTGYKSNAKERQELAQERVRLQGERARIEAERNQTKRMRETIAKQLEEVNAKLKVQLSEDDIYDDNQRLDTAKLNAVMEQKSARAEVVKLQQQLAEIEASTKSTEYETFHNDLNLFITEFPQYLTSEAINVIGSKLDKNMSVDIEDVVKFKEVFDIISEARRSGMSPSIIYEIRKRQGTLAVKPSAQSKGTDDESQPKLKIPSQKEILDEKLRRLEEKTKIAPASIGGGSTNESRTNDKKTVAEKMIEDGRKITGKADSKFLKDLGYN